ncbi:MAG: hemerythrin domain-containing protein [Nitriliruptorales bacterium]
MDAMTLLASQHRTVEKAFSQFEELDPDASARRLSLARGIIRSLSVHAALEEQVFYPGVRLAAPRLDEQIQADLDEHQRAKELLARWETLRADDPEFDEVLTEIRALILEHVVDEEERLFPAVAGEVPAVMVAQMALAMQALAFVSPTRPHPEAPNQPPLNLLVGPLATAFDYLKDVVKRSGGSMTP